MNLDARDVSINRSHRRTLNLGMMVDGNARSAFVDVMLSFGLSADDLRSSSVQRRVREEYLRKLPYTYLKNARWCARLGEELFKRTDSSEYVIFVYNVTNRARGHFRGIEYAIHEAGGEIVKRLGRFGDVCLLGPNSEKGRWMKMYPDLKEVKGPSDGNRTIILTGYQRGCGEDDGAGHMRPLDFFIRSTQMRFSGMFLPCMDDTHMVTLSHMPYKYHPSDIINKLFEEKEKDEEHDDANVYSPFIYDLWLEHERRQLSMYITTNALPPREHFFNDHSSEGEDTIHSN